MRILKVTQAYYPFRARGGPAIKVRSIARGLKERGNDVVVATADLGFGPEEIAAAKVVICNEFWRSELDGVETIYFKTRGHYRNLTFNPGLIGFCRQRLREFDIVHVYGLYDALGPVVGRYCGKFNIPYFVEPLGMTLPIDRGFLLKKIWRRLGKGYLERATKWVATSELEKQDLLAAGVPGEKLLLRFNGIDRANFAKLPQFGAFRKRVGIAAEIRIILFLGRLIPRKGADLLIEALPHIGDATVKLVIAGPEGESGYLAFLRDKARLLRLEQQVLFSGALYGEAQKEAYVDATVFTLPSRYENFGNTAAEAVACGTPVVISDRCGIAPLIDQRAGLVTQYELQSLAQALKELLDNSALYERLKAGCPLVAEEIFWDGLIEEMQGHYEEARSHFALRQ